MLWIGGAWALKSYGFMPADEVDLRDSIFGVNGVYVPILSTQGKMDKNVSSENLASYDRQSLLAIHQQILSVLSQNGYTLRGNEQQYQREMLTKQYFLACEIPGEVPLPLFASSLHWVHIKELDTQKERQLPCSENPSFPGICRVVIDHPGTYEIEWCLL